MADIRIIIVVLSPAAMFLIFFRIISCSGFDRPDIILSIMTFGFGIVWLVVGACFVAGAWLLFATGSPVSSPVRASTHSNATSNAAAT